MHQKLFGQLSDMPGLALNIDDKTCCELLSFGNPQLNIVSNWKILEATISFVKSMKRLSNRIQAVAQQ